MSDTDTANPLLHIVDKEKLMIVHRQWIRANRVKKYYEHALGQVDEEVRKDISRFYLSDAGIFMFLWYSLLYSVLKFFDEQKVDLKSLDSDYETLFDALRRSRNSVLHAEKKYWDDRQIELIAQPDAGQRIRAIHDQLDKYFLEVLRKDK